MTLVQAKSLATHFDSHVIIGISMAYQMVGNRLLGVFDVKKVKMIIVDDADVVLTTTNTFRISAETIPSSQPLDGWPPYIEYRTSMMDDGIAIYCITQYTRIRLGIDTLAADLVEGGEHGHPNKCHVAIVYVGAADFEPNSPIRMKKNIRCLGVCHILAAFMNLKNCHIIWVDEYNTSQQHLTLQRQAPDVYLIRGPLTKRHGIRSRLSGNLST